MISWVWSSKREPRPISKNRLKSLSELLLEPYAMLEGTETAHLRIWDFNPNSSFFGKKSEAV